MHFHLFGEYLHSVKKQVLAASVHYWKINHGKEFGGLIKYIDPLSQLHIGSSRSGSRPCDFVHLAITQATGR